MNLKLESKTLIELDNISNDCDTVFPSKPFENIALTFSGGGFRAASFSLGVLSYLNRCYLTGENDKLINHVRFITSTSGGSITNGMYSIFSYNASEFDFSSFYDELKNAMNGETLLAKVFAILKDDSLWTEEGTLIKNGESIKVKKSRNLINAFAKTYDQVLFKGKTLDCIYSCTNSAHLEEICFNSTEFNNGLNFYFQVDGKTPAIQQRGNSYLKFKNPDVIRHLKISDIVAASSCFPGGFEPIMYPTDFVHEGLTDVNEMFDAVDYRHNNPLDADKIKNEPFPLMDGGIADNMGIRSVMIEDNIRLRENKGRFDLILACDVTSYFNDPINQPAVSTNRGLKIQTIINLFKFSVILFFISVLSIIFQVYPIAGYLLIIPSFLFGLVYIIGASKLAGLKHSENGSVAKMGLKYIDYFLKLPMGVLIPMLVSRANSIIKLVSDLFLKQIRRGQYDNLFTKPRLVHRTISCLIYEFSKQHQERRVSILESKDRAWWNDVSTILMPSQALQETANEAKSMGTTLWFDEGDVSIQKRDKVIAAGQFTCCYNLIKHICRLELLNPNHKNDIHLQDLKKRLFEDWERFQNKPDFMV